MSDPLADLRAEITANDRRIVEAFNERLRLVGELWAVKRAVGSPQLDPERERALRAELTEANRGPLSAEGLDRLVAALLDLTKSELAGS